MSEDGMTPPTTPQDMCLPWKFSIEENWNGGKYPAIRNCNGKFVTFTDSRIWPEIVISVNERQMLLKKAELFDSLKDKIMTLLAGGNVPHLYSEIKAIIKESEEL